MINIDHFKTAATGTSGIGLIQIIHMIDPVQLASASQIIIQIIIGIATLWQLIKKKKP